MSLATCGEQRASRHSVMLFGPEAQVIPMASLGQNPGIGQGGDLRKPQAPKIGKSPFDEIRHVDEDPEAGEFEWWSARELMPHATVLVPGYGAQGASAAEAVKGARADGSGIVVNASRSLMYAYLKRPGAAPADAAQAAAETMRTELNAALNARGGT